MNRKHRERCERAIATLWALKLPKGAHFDMGEWGSHSAAHRPTADNYCGTAACAAGWLSLDPWFRRRGMKGEWTKRLFNDYELNPFGHDKDPDEELPRFFGLTFEESLEVFGSWHRGTAKQAARRLQWILNKYDRQGDRK